MEGGLPETQEAPRKSRAQRLTSQQIHDIVGLRKSRCRCMRGGQNAQWVFKLSHLLCKKTQCHESPSEPFHPFEHTSPVIFPPSAAAVEALSPGCAVSHCHGCLSVKVDLWWSLGESQESQGARQVTELAEDAP